MMRSKVVKVTPAIATAWLRKNVINRELRAAVVDTYANAMRRGDWRLSPQGIAFDVDGNLADGQHRLNAIVLSGKTVDMVVWEHVAKDAFEIIDVGAKRTTADIMGIDKSAVAVGNFVAKIAEPDIRGAITAQIAAPYIRAFNPYLDQLLNGSSHASRTWAAAAVRAAAVIRIANGEDAGYIKGVYHSLIARDFDLMPAIAQAWFRQQMDGGTRNSVDMFCRGLSVFDRSKSTIRRLQVTATDSGLSFARGVIADVLNGKEKARKSAPKLMRSKADSIAA